MGNETSIKVSKSKTTLNIMNKSWGNPINNGLNFVKIHANAISKDNITQKFHFRLMEFTFLQFGIKSDFLDLFQDKTYMVFMVLHVF
jgi:hypothetical protein